MSAVYASHGDTKHVVLIPSTPKECFDFSADALDIADRLQTPVIIMSDLELGMNEVMSDPLEWDDNRKYDRGKVYDATDLDRIEKFGRYVDIDGDGIGYRTYPGTHPTKGSFFTRGTSRDEYARYTEDPDIYTENMDRLLKKWATAKTLVPKPDIHEASPRRAYGIIYYGTTLMPMQESLDLLGNDGIHLDTMRIRAVPFADPVLEFIDNHELVFIVEQNRDAQMRMILVNEGGIDPAKIVPVCYYGGMSIAAEFIRGTIADYFAMNKLARISEVKR
jgi:2-oxoglutarate ferredoxin oxidoreductase subunit alpha